VEKEDMGVRRRNGGVVWERMDPGNHHVLLGCLLEDDVWVDLPATKGMAPKVMICEKNRRRGV
jgi:hypothetical protein